MTASYPGTVKGLKVPPRQRLRVIPQPVVKMEGAAAGPAFRHRHLVAVGPQSGQIKGLQVLRQSRM